MIDSSCATAATFTQTVTGPFCSVQHLNAPAQFFNAKTDSIIQEKQSFPLFPFQTTLYLFSLILLVANLGVNGKQFNRLMEGLVIRYGPHQKQFLPYLLATHGI